MRIVLMVEQVTVEMIEVTKFGDTEPDVVPGHTYVTFGNGRDRVKIDWTFRQGEPLPQPGSRWVLQADAS